MLNNLFYNIVLFLVLIGSLLGAVWYWAKDNLKKDIAEDEAKDARKDEKIGAEPNKSRPDLIKWVRKLSKRS